MLTYLGLSNSEAKQLIDLIDNFEKSNQQPVSFKPAEQNPEIFSENNFSAYEEQEEKEEEDLFRSYMRQKEHEYRQSKHLSNLDLSSINKVVKSSSGNSSLGSVTSSSGSTNSLMILDTEEYDEEGTLPSHHQLQHNRRVTFESSQQRRRESGIKSMSRSSRNIQKKSQYIKATRYERFCLFLKTCVHFYVRILG